MTIAEVREYLFLTEECHIYATVRVQSEEDEPLEITVKGSEYPASFKEFQSFFSALHEVTSRIEKMNIERLNRDPQDP